MNVSRQSRSERGGIIANLVALLFLVALCAVLYFARHPILRTGFAWQDQTQPLQIVVRDLTVPMTRQDWRGVAVAERGEKLRAFLDADRRQGFRLSKPPLLRLALLHGEGEHTLVWTHHHILMDGWFRPLLLRELFLLYAVGGAVLINGDPLAAGSSAPAFSITSPRPAGRTCC